MSAQVVAESGQCAAVAVIRAQSAAPNTMPPFVLATFALRQRDFAFLRIAGQATR